nr:molecular chaperone DnaJ [uncultured Peptoniphilus sp.]
MGQIIEFPDIKKLKEKIRFLRRELEDLYPEKEHLVGVVCENIQRDYTLVFGSLEYKLYEAYCEYLRLRRKRDLIQAKVNRGEKPDMEAIESRLDEEFREYKRRLEEQMEEINEAIEKSKLKLLPEEEQMELKKLYKAIVKRLHPDLNPSITEGEKELFYNATESYKLGDLITLRIIYDLTVKGEEEELSLPNASLVKEAERLEKAIVAIREEIERIKSNPPYSLKIYLEDERKKAVRLYTLRSETQSFYRAIQTQEEAIRDIMEDAL